MGVNAARFALQLFEDPWATSHIRRGPDRSLHPPARLLFKIMSIKLNKDIICLQKPFLPCISIARASPLPLSHQRKEGPQLQEASGDVHGARRVGCTPRPYSHQQCEVLASPGVGGSPLGAVWQ